MEPLVLDADQQEPLTITVLSSGQETGFAFDFANGDYRELTQVGDNLFTITVSHEEAMYDFTASDVNRNFLGYLEHWTDDTMYIRANVFVEIKDQSIPPVVVDDIAPGIRLSPHVVNLHLPDIDIQALDRAAVARLFYRHFPDNFDFLNIVSTPQVGMNRFYARVQNKTQGTGVPLFDSSSHYGSAGRLLGLIRFPITSYFDLAARTYSHEIGHHWVNHSDHEKLQGVRPHWPVSSLAHSVMGYQTTGQGLTFPYRIVAVSDDEYQLQIEWESTRIFNGMELYLMGLIGPDDAGTYIVFENQGQTLCHLCLLTGPVVNFAVSDLVASEGLRDPAWPEDQTEFNVATVIVSRERPLSDREMRYYDYFASRGMAREELPYSMGFASGMTLPFHLATQGKGTLNTVISERLLDTIHKSGFEASPRLTFDE